MAKNAFDDFIDDDRQAELHAAIAAVQEIRQQGAALETRIGELESALPKLQTAAKVAGDDLQAAINRHGRGLAGADDVTTARAKHDAAIAAVTSAKRDRETLVSGRRTLSEETRRAVDEAARARFVALNSCGNAIATSVKADPLLAEKILMLYALFLVSRQDASHLNSKISWHDALARVFAVDPQRLGDFRTTAESIFTTPHRD